MVLDRGNRRVHQEHIIRRRQARRHHDYHDSAEATRHQIANKLCGFSYCVRSVIRADGAILSTPPPTSVPLSPMVDSTCFLVVYSGRQTSSQRLNLRGRKVSREPGDKIQRRVLHCSSPSNVNGGDCEGVPRSAGLPDIRQQARVWHMRRRCSGALCNGPSANTVTNSS